MATQDDAGATGRTPGERRPARLRSGDAGGRHDVLRLLASEGAGTVASLADRTGLHENTVRSHLDRLVRDGLAAREVEVRTVRGRPRHVYRAVLPPGGPEDGREGGRDGGPGPARGLDEAAARAGLTRMLLAGYGAAEADVVVAARQAGEQLLGTLPGAPRPGGTGSQADQLRELTGHLDRLGFDPVPADGPVPVVQLWRCPFLDLARARPEVVCAVHLGLARGVLDRVGGPLRADRLVPFAGPRHCDLHLTVAT
jgi:predicted ArsR family transcriptional regulator